MRIGLANFLPKPFRTLLHEQDLDRHQDDPDVHNQRIVLDVHQVQLQLVVGRGVVLPVYLRISCQPSLHLHPVRELRDLLCIKLHMLHPLRPRPHDAHVTLQDVEQLWELVHPARPDDSPHRRDPRVPVRRGDRMPVLLRVHHHAPELADGEHLPVPRAPVLPVEHRTPIVHLDRDGDHQEDGRQEHQRRQGQYDVHQPLHELLVRRQPRVSRKQQRRVEHVQLLRAPQQDVGDLRRRIGPYGLPIAVLQDHIPCV